MSAEFDLAEPLPYYGDLEWQSCRYGVVIAASEVCAAAAA